jgi:hypothetical protein
MSVAYLKVSSRTHHNSWRIYFPTLDSRKHLGLVKVWFPYLVRDTHSIMAEHIKLKKALRNSNRQPCRMMCGIRFHVLFWAFFFG